MMWNGKAKAKNLLHSDDEDEEEDDIAIAKFKLQVKALEDRVKYLEIELSYYKKRNDEQSLFLQDVTMRLVDKAGSAASVPYRNVAEAYRAAGAKAKDSGADNTRPTAGPLGKLPG
jgi:hypothetical protein